MRLLAACDVIPGNLALVVRTRIHEGQSPVEGQIVERGLFPDFAQSGIDRLLTRFDQPLGEIPIAISAQQQKFQLPLRDVHHHDTGGQSMRCGGRRHLSLSYGRCPPPTPAALGYPYAAAESVTPMRPRKLASGSGGRRRRAMPSPPHPPL